MQTDDLIDQLATQLHPVRRLRAPLWRAMSWCGFIGVLVLLLVLRFANLGVVNARFGVTRIALEWLGCSLTAITATVVAFEWSVPGCSRRWAWLPLPPLLLWLGASGLGCLQNGLGLHSVSVRESPGCFTFIAAVSVPLALTLFWMLRQAQPIAPLPVAAFGALGVAATAATVLQFFHPFDVTGIDLTFHLAAVLLVVFLSTVLRRPLLRSSR
jgi:hypothetical protein